MSDDRVMMKNPNTGKDDVRIRRTMYEPVRDAILAAVDDRGELPFSELRDEVEARTPATLWDDASVGWYTTVVKLHLEATEFVARSGSPQILTLTEAGRAARLPASC